MKFRLLAMFMIVTLAVTVLWLTISPQREPPAQIAEDNSPGTVRTTQVAPPRSEPITTEETPGVIEDTATSDPSESTPVRSKATARARTLATSSGSEPMSDYPPAVVLENMRSMFRNYSSRFGGNPVGTNLEITSVLNGGNPEQAVFLNPEDGLRVNDRGELVDNWDTPYFFHQLSRTEMEIHSAGPDRKMWTSDDLVIK